MPEHDEPDAPELTDEDEFWADVEEIEQSRTPNLRIPKSKRWKVENKADEAEQK